MVRIELTDEEAVTLREVLTSYLGDLRMEVANTDSMDFRESLKQTEVLLKALIERLGPV